MKIRMTVHLLALCGILLALFGCEGGGTSSTSDEEVLSSPFAWMSGSDTIDATGVYGTQSTPATTNVPGARKGATSWTDASGNLWLFGGNGIGSTGYGSSLNDLWKYSPWSGEWTWIGGSDTNDAAGVYGTQGTPAATNVPGARKDAISWTDTSGNLWLFGGVGYDSTDSYSYLNDLWEYSPSSGEWTWMSGSDTINAAGVYGTKGKPAATNVPGARFGAVRWTDISGNLWLFGGIGVDSAGSYGNFNDLWKYNPSSGEWTWIDGSDTIEAAGVYGTQGTAATTNVPGARFSAISWTDTSDNLWLFGGQGNGSPGNFGELNDLWKYSPSSGMWTWVSGSDTAYATGVYGTQGAAAATNVPGARDGAISWTDTSGNLWLLGGIHFDSAGNFIIFNDLWKFSPSSDEWTWIGGSDTINAAGVYDTQGTAATTNVPGARDRAISWTDNSGNLWLFGGWGYDSSGNRGLLNDLWTFTP